MSPQNSNKIDQAAILKIAKLARLELNDDEAKSLEKDLSDIINYVNKLSEVNTSGVKATTQVHNLVNIFREDISRKSYTSEEIENIAPDFAGSGFRVPKVL